MTVLVPPPLHSYTAGVSRVEAEGRTLDALLDDLDRRHPGIRFRIIDEQGRVRPHIKLFVNARLAPEIARPVAPSDEIQIVCALSGG
ncbi:MAG TPA: MoaD/ThiS family protein [Candidatus Polarisedimenticolia bacterium]|nr:MoaD/ThiS family protein [Candidatus Polarisedimenticolia bacterium]